MKQLTITLNEDKSLSIQANQPLNTQDTVDLALSTVLAMFNSTVEHTPEQQKQEVKEFLYNTFNIAASALLAQFAPDIDLRPDITEEALLKAEFELASDILNNQHHEPLC